MLLTLQAGVSTIITHAPWFFPLLGGILGGVIASFLGCMAYRIPRGIALTQPPSQCNFCQRPLTIIQLIPVVSWLAQRGRCACAKHPLPHSLLVTEVTAVIAGATLAALLQG